MAHEQQERRSLDLGRGPGPRPQYAEPGALHQRHRDLPAEIGSDGHRHALVLAGADEGLDVGSASRRRSTGWSTLSGSDTAKFTPPALSARAPPARRPVRIRRASGAMLGSGRLRRARRTSPQAASTFHAFPAGGCACPVHASGRHRDRLGCSRCRRRRRSTVRARYGVGATAPRTTRASGRGPPDVQETADGDHREVPLPEPKLLEAAYLGPGRRRHRTSTTSSPGAGWSPRGPV